jgi:hypothetical protein
MSGSPLKANVVQQIGFVLQYVRGGLLLLAVARLRIQGAAYTASRLCTEPLMY